MVEQRKVEGHAGRGRGGASGIEGQQDEVISASLIVEEKDPQRRAAELRKARTKVLARHQSRFLKG